MFGPRFLALLLLSVASLALTGCGPGESTGILVQISVDDSIDIPDDADGLQLSAIGLASEQKQSALGWDLKRTASWGLKPGGDDTETVMIRGDLTRKNSDGDAVLITTKRVKATFKPGKVVKVQLFFEKGCLDVICGDKEIVNGEVSNKSCISGEGNDAKAAIACSLGDCRTNEAGSDPECRDAEECATASDCDDKDANTEDFCIDRICSHTGGSTDSGADPDAAEDAAVATDADVGDAAP